MKRAIALVLLSFFVWGLFGCAEESDPSMSTATDAEVSDGSENGDGTEELYDWTSAEEAPIPDEDYEIRLIVDPVVKVRYNLPNLAMYKVEVTEWSNGSFRVRYRLMIGGYDTYEEYNVRLDADKNIVSISGEQGKYFRFLPYATPERLEAARQRLYQKIREAGLEPDRDEYLTLNQNGELCFEIGIIVDIPNPSGMGGGCGIDHEHKIFYEPICSAPARESLEEDQ